AHDLLHGVLVYYRAHIDFRIGAVAYAQGLRALDEFIAELLVHFLMHDQPRRSRAALTGSPERAPDRAFYRIVDVGVVHDDNCVLTAHLKRTDCVSLGACGGHYTTRFSRAGN